MLFSIGVGGCGFDDVCCIVWRNRYVWIECECGADDGILVTCRVLVRRGVCRLRVWSCVVENNVKSGGW